MDPYQGVYGTSLIGALALVLLTGNIVAGMRFMARRTRTAFGDQKLIENERAKLTATYLNTLGAGSVAVGALTPATTVVLAFERGTSTDWTLLFGSAVWLPAGIALHLAGRFALGGLKS